MHKHLATKKLVEARMERGWSQRRTAQEADVHLNTVWKTETEQSHPSYEVAIKISRALGLDPREIEEFAPVVEAAEGPREETRRDLEFAEREDLVGLVEAEAANTTGVSPAERDIWADPELVRLGLFHALRALMRHVGREETLRAFQHEFGERE